MPKPKQYFCPHCDRTFGLGASLQDHVEDAHSMGDDHTLPAELSWMLGSAVESGWYDED